MPNRYPEPGWTPPATEPGQGVPPARGKRICGAIAVGWGLFVGFLFAPEVAKNQDVFGDLATGAVVEGDTIPVIYTVCYGVTVVAGA